MTAMLNKFLLSISFIFFFAITANAQKAINIRVETTADQLIVSYDLTGNSEAIYNINLKFLKDDGTYILPKSTNGDIGKVSAGMHKKIVWQVYKDVKALKGNIEPVLDVETFKAAPQKPVASPTPPQPKAYKPTIDIKTAPKQKKHLPIIGVKLSTGKSKAVETNNGNTFNKKRSWQAGLYSRFNLNKKIYLQPELLYHRQSYEELFNKVDFETTHKHYGRAQLLAGVKPIGFGLYFNAGFYYGHLLGGKTTTTINQENTTLTFDQLPEMNNEKLPYLNSDFGYLLGGALSLGRGNLALGVLYNKSFNNVVNINYQVPNDPSGPSISITSPILKNSSVHFFLQKSIN